MNQTDSQDVEIRVSRKKKKKREKHRNTGGKLKKQKVQIKTKIEIKDIVEKELNVEVQRKGSEALKDKLLNSIYLK